ncbi:MAG: hypothetical protein PQJ60_12900 [Spirochaetales bacterium]|nr:hypothetical protein [Spirochaetales bacterium]
MGGFFVWGEMYKGCLREGYAGGEADAVGGRSEQRSPEQPASAFGGTRPK